MARKVRQMRRKGKHVGLVSAPSLSIPTISSRVALIQALIPVALERVEAALQEEVTHLAGARYAREGRRPGHVRWTPQSGSIYLADQKIPLEVPRVRDRWRNQEVPLETYQQLQQPREMDTGLLHKILGGLSTREYERCAEAVAGMTRSGERCTVAATDEHRGVLWDLASSPATLNPCGTGTMTLPKVWTGEKK